MPKRNSASYAVVFVGIIATLSSLFLSVVSEGVKERKLLNVELEQKRNVLKSFGIAVPQGADATAINKLYEPVRSIVVDAHGNVLDDVDVATVDSVKGLDEQQRLKASGHVSECLYAVHMLVGKNDIVEAYSIPIRGQGLWSKLYGYVALENDLNTILGITFYKQGETPGLGAEIAAPWFQENFVGKKLHDADGELKSVSVVRGLAADRYEGDELSHYVDGISGATITGNGVSDCLREYFEAYKPYFDAVGKGENSDG